MTRPVLAFGAAGKFAGPVVPSLVARCVTVRAFVCCQKGEVRVFASGAQEAATGEFGARASVVHALQVIEQVFFRELAGQSEARA